MIALINTNLMRPPIAPIGLDYIATTLRCAGIETDIVDLCLADHPEAALEQYLRGHTPELIGLTLRNTDDSFYPSMQSFLPAFRRVIEKVRALTDTPVVLGGAGYSIFPQRIAEITGADFGIRGDGESGLLALCLALRKGSALADVPGLLWRDSGRIRANPACWPAAFDSPRIPTSRDAIDNRAYFRLGGQIGLETKRGCNRRCFFCADVLGKGHMLRLRHPADVATEAQTLLGQGIDVLHLCDAEFNIPYEHAMAVCEEFIARGLGKRIRWYAYLAIVPFDVPLAVAMRRAGCVGINFTGPAASDVMLAAYRQPHRQADIAATVAACKQAGLTVMLDLMLGGPGETPPSMAEAIGFVKYLPVDCAGAGLGVRLYPGLGILDEIAAEAPLEAHPAVRRRYDGPVDLLQPTFYVSAALGEHPAERIREAIAGDKRFFEPSDENDRGSPPVPESHGYNYNNNDPLTLAIAAGARGAYWDILRRLHA